MDVLIASQASLEDIVKELKMLLLQAGINSFQATYVSSGFIPGIRLDKSHRGWNEFVPDCTYMLPHNVTLIAMKPGISFTTNTSSIQ